MKDFNKISRLFAAVIVSIIFILLSASVSAQEEKSVTDLREEIEGMNLTSGEKYYQIADMRSKTILMLYTMERVNVSADVKQFIFSVKDFLDTFESTYKKSETGNASVHKEVIKKASDMKKMASDLESYKNNPKLTEYVYVPIIVENAYDAVKRFLDDEGIYFEDMAEYENVTAIRIWHLRDAITAYEESENNEKRLEVQDAYKEINSEFFYDMRTAETEKAEADDLLNKSDALKDSENVLDLFSAFVSSTEAGMKYSNIEKIYIGHNLNSKGCLENLKCSNDYYEIFTEVVDKNNRVSEISDSLKGRILIYVIGITLALLLILIYFKINYSTYKADIRSAKLGVELGLDKVE